jgi:6-phosphogluconolactonase (cycloisomerase 2 family)
MKKQILIIILGLFALFIVAFSSGRAIAPANAQGVVGSVYVMTNSATGNQVIAYSRAPDGTLTWQANYATNGLGIAGLTGSNQGGLVLSENGQWLIVANAGSNDISVFSVNHEGLTLIDKTNSQGTMPISVTVHGDLVYVLNTGGAGSIGNIAGFNLNDGKLSSISGSVQPKWDDSACADIVQPPR